MSGASGMETILDSGWRIDPEGLLGGMDIHGAPLCSCHRDSLTRARLAIVQEAVRVFFFSVFSIGFCT